MTYLRLNLNQLKQDLREIVAEVIFDKIDGERRTMRCTLMQRYLPRDFDFNEQYELDTKNMIVWDLDHHGWRSFSVDRVLSCQMMPGWN